MYNDFLVSRPKNQKGFLKKAHISILRFQRSAYYLATAGGQSWVQKELAEVQGDLDAYSIELLEVAWSSYDFEEVQNPLKRLTHQYRVFDSNIHHEELQQVT